MKFSAAKVLCYAVFAVVIQMFTLYNVIIVLLAENFKGCSQEFQKRCSNGRMNIKLGAQLPDADESYVHACRV